MIIIAAGQRQMTQDDVSQVLPMTALLKAFIVNTGVSDVFLQQTLLTVTFTQDSLH